MSFLQAFAITLVLLKNSMFPGPFSTMDEQSCTMNSVRILEWRQSLGHLVMMEFPSGWKHRTNTSCVFVCYKPTKALPISFQWLFDPLPVPLVKLSAKGTYYVDFSCRASPCSTCSWICDWSAAADAVSRKFKLGSTAMTCFKQTIWPSHGLGTSAKLKSSNHHSDSQNSEAMEYLIHLI